MHRTGASEHCELQAESVGTRFSSLVVPFVVTKELWMTMGPEVKQHLLQRFQTLKLFVQSSEAASELTHVMTALKLIFGSAFRVRVEYICEDRCVNSMHSKDRV